MNKTIEEDCRTFYVGQQKELLRRLQDCLEPEHAMRQAILKLKTANERVDEALERLDRLATDQANIAQLKLEAMEITLLLGMLSGCETQQEVKLRRKQIRTTLQQMGE